jgi:hypothetical protein
MCTSNAWSGGCSCLTNFSGNVLVSYQVYKDTTVVPDIQGLLWEFPVPFTSTFDRRRQSRSVVDDRVGIVLDGGHWRSRTQADSPVLWRGWQTTVLEEPHQSIQPLTSYPHSVLSGHPPSSGSPDQQGRLEQPPTAQLIQSGSPGNDAASSFPIFGFTRYEARLSSGPSISSSSP